MLSSRRFHALLWIAVFLLLEPLAQSCGPDWPNAVFVKQHGPDAPYKTFAAGRLGVPQPGYRTRHLVVLYNYLSGRALSPTEQNDAVDADRQFTSSWDTSQHADAANTDLNAWVAARNSLGPIDGYTPAENFSTERRADYSYVNNCMGDAFRVATLTLASRQASYGKTSPEVIEWARGQDAVFRDCANTTATPKELPSSAPLWLQQDRAYQLAAAQMYAAHYDDAVSRFRAIAADTTSPWSILARYLVGRTLTNRATDAELDYTPLTPNESTEQRKDRIYTQLRAARAEWLDMRSEPRMQPMLHAIDSMIDRITSRLQPQQQARLLASRLGSATPDPNFKQDLLDLSYIRSTDPYATQPIPHNTTSTLGHPATDTDRRADDMLRWLDAFQNADRTTALEQWQSTHSRPWLLATLTFSKPTDAATPELLTAARDIPRADHAYIPIAYQRLRLSPADSITRLAVLDLLPAVTENESISTRNAFSELNARTAPDLNTWLQQAARKLAAEAVDGDEEQGFEPTSRPQPCGPALADAETSLFPADAATILNTRLPPAPDGRGRAEPDAPTQRPLPGSASRLDTRRSAGSPRGSPCPHPHTHCLQPALENRVEHLRSLHTRRQPQGCRALRAHALRLH